MTHGSAVAALLAQRRSPQVMHTYRIEAPNSTYSETQTLAFIFKPTWELKTWSKHHGTVMKIKRENALH